MNNSLMQAEKRPRVLMCPPDYFQVIYTINPWMSGNEYQLDLDKVKKQWKKLKACIGQFAEIEIMPAVKGIPDLIFTANAGVVYKECAIVSTFMNTERKAEEPYFNTAFRSLGFKMHKLPEGVIFEGAGDCLLDRGGEWVWAAFGIRSELAGHKALEKFFEREVISLKLIDKRFYHLDTCMCPLDDGYLMYYPPAFDYVSLLAIESRVPPEKRIVVDTADAGHFSCNAVNIGKNIIMNKTSDYLRNKLISEGFTVHEVNLSEILKAGGSAKCLTLQLNETGM
jgi:N-dimethylarginine dimethylaminohydrolase